GLAQDHPAVEAKHLRLGGFFGARSPDPIQQ
ncbi:MAG: hypothetical protein QOE89_4047, partial [Pseudonocardiales bacterium]|nr:hypothetical protein [Pseudonocardiales bacterium]